MSAVGAAAVFLDRDGVLNEAVVVDGVPRPPAVDDVRLLPGVEAACRTLREHGLLLLVVTNQPDVARGTVQMGDVEAINRWLGSRLPIDEFLVCPHDDPDGCDCRKPAPGLLRRAETARRLDLSRSVMVGDRWRDVAAGVAAGCGTVFVDHGYHELVDVAPDLVVHSLHEAVPWILARTGAGTLR